MRREWEAEVNKNANPRNIFREEDKSVWLSTVPRGTWHNRQPLKFFKGPSEQFLRRGRSCNQEPFSWLILVAAVTCLLASILCIAYSVYCTT